MITPSVMNVLARARMEELRRAGERERLARAAHARSRGDRTWVSWWLSRFAPRTTAMRSPRAAQRASDDVRARADVAPAARVEPQPQRM